MVKKDVKDLVKKLNAIKSSKKKNSGAKTSKSKKKLEKKETIDSDEEYKLPNPEFECPDENAEQALSASFIEVYEQKLKSKITENLQELTDEKSTKRKKLRTEENPDVENALKRKLNKENNSSDIKKRRVKETSKGSGRQRNQANEIKVEACNINVGKESIKETTVLPKQNSRKEKADTGESEINHSDDLETHIGSTEGQISLSVGNLPIGCDKEALNFFFNESDLYPQISFKKKAVRIKSEKGEKRSKNVKGSATLICKTQAEADEILKLNGLAMTSVTGDESEVVISAKKSTDKIQSTTKLFVGALHPKVPESQLQEALEDEGISVVKVKRARWNGGRRPKGYAFVWLPTEEDVSKALNTDLTMEGKQLVITHCETKSKKK